MDPTLSIVELERILQLARAATPERGTLEPSVIARAERNGRLPLSFAQQRLWFLEQLGDLGGTYHTGTRLRLRGALDRAALARALDRIVARHEALRTTFAQVDGVPEQRIAPADAGFHLVEHDLTGRAGADAALEAMRPEALGEQRLTVESCDNRQGDMREWLQGRIDADAGGSVFRCLLRFLTNFFTHRPTAAVLRGIAE